MTKDFAANVFQDFISKGKFSMFIYLLFLQSAKISELSDHFNWRCCLNYGIFVVLWVVFWKFQNNGQKQNINNFVLQSFRQIKKCSDSRFFLYHSQNNIILDVCTIMDTRVSKFCTLHWLSSKNLIKDTK